MEDFGYVKDDKKKDATALTKKIFLTCATLFSISCFIYITINAYYYVYQDKNAEVETIKSPEEPIKVIEEDAVVITGGAGKINDSIYEDIFGNKKESLAKVTPKIRISPEPALPPKPTAEDKLLNESTPIVTTATTEKESQKPNKQADRGMIVYRDKPQENTGSQDFLNKGKVEAKIPTNTSGRDVAAPNKSNKRKYLRIQVAAVTSKKSAEEYWSKIRDANPRLFSGLKPFTEEVNLGKRGIFYRLQIGNFSDQVDAEEFCGHYTSQMNKSKADCIVVE
jgi:hypothetical protein